MQNRIKELRLDRGLTLGQVAERVGCSPIQILRLENGERRLSFDWVEKIAAALSVTPATLLPDFPAGEGEIIKDPFERKLLREVRKLTPAQLDMLHSLFRSWARDMRAGDKPKRRTA